MLKLNWTAGFRIRCKFMCEERFPGDLENFAFLNLKISLRRGLFNSGKGGFASWFLAGRFVCLRRSLWVSGRESNVEVDRMGGWMDACVEGCCW